MALIKVCGLTETTGLDAALALGVTRIGLVFAPSSPRLIDLETAQHLAQITRNKAEIVVVLVDPGDKLLQRLATTIQPDFWQLHGKESPDRVRSIWKKTRIPVIKAFSVSGPKDIKDADRYQRTAAEFLFDAKPPKTANRTGGLGVCFDWNWLAQVQPARPFLLAGGLAAQNVAEAIAICRAPMVDVSSGVETAPGVKDPQLLAQFCQAARGTDLR